MAIPVYSERFFSVHNLAGPKDYTNESGNTFIVRTFTASYGGDLPDDLFFVDDVDCTLIWDHANGVLDGDVAHHHLYLNLHLVWPAGTTWRVLTGSQWDWSAHGYTLSGP